MIKRLTEQDMLDPNWVYPELELIRNYVIELEETLEETKTTTPDIDMVEKPPLGLTPKFIWKEARERDIFESMIRYTSEGKPIPDHWIHELSELISSSRTK